MYLLILKKHKKAKSETNENGYLQEWETGWE